MLHTTDIGTSVGNLDLEIEFSFFVAVFKGGLG
jgi:hypothetical protein